MSSFELTNLFSVKGKVVLVTGGSRGIGKMIATGFVRNGAKVYVSSRSAKDCDKTASELTALGPGTCISLPANLQSVQEIQRLVSELKSREQVLDVLINNAGAAWGESVDTHSDDGFTKVITLNLQRVFTLTQALLPLLRASAAKSKDGRTHKDPARIINIGSIEGLGVPDHETYAYAAAKAGLHQLSRHLAGRLGREGITSNTIACGLFITKMTAYTAQTEEGKGWLDNIPLRRSGTPEDVAGTAIYLASPASAYVNGATLTLDGGNLVNMPSQSKL
ncbi:NAD(P)-binding protein [Schizophyllum commune Tattone D]|nr:NAD(P)-binding protein [Schizophyllum commune Tattone D]